MADSSRQQQQYSRSSTLSMLHVLLLAIVVLAPDTASAKKSGGGGGGGSYGSGGSSSSGGGGGGWFGGGGGGSASSLSSTPVKIDSPGAGYANSNNFATGSSSYGGRYSQYPNGGYHNNNNNNGGSSSNSNSNSGMGAGVGSAGMGAFFLSTRSHRRAYNDDGKYNNTDEYYFDRVVNGCQFVGVDSYRTIDYEESTTTTTIDDDDVWVGCTEEWKYNVVVVANSNRRLGTNFVSPPIELYACDKYDTCADCGAEPDSELRGTDFDALRLAAFSYPENEAEDYYVDCYIPKNLTLVNEEYVCTNEDCIFLSEKYTEAVASSGVSFAVAAGNWMGIMAMGGIAMALYAI